MEPLRIALLGSRGIPANYGGYETLMEEVSVRLAELGHRVTVYCRSHYTSRDLREHRGVRLVVLPTIKTKYLDTPVHTFLSCLHTLKQRYDAALLVNSANAPLRADPAVWEARQRRYTWTVSRNAAPSGALSGGRSTRSPSAWPACCRTPW